MSRVSEDLQVIGKRKSGRVKSILAVAPVRTVEERATIICQYLDEAKSCFAQGAIRVLMIGFELHASQEQISHGEWADWVECHCHLDRRTAWKYMQAAERKFKSISELNESFDLDENPKTMTPERREQLLDVLRSCTGNQTARQMLLGLGLETERKRSAGEAGGHAAPTAAALENKLRWRAEQTWMISLGKTIYGEARRETWKVLSREQISGVAAIMEQTAKEMKAWLAKS